MIDTPYATFYPSSMFVRIGKRLYDFSGWDNMDFQFWFEFVHGQNNLLREIQNGTESTIELESTVKLWPSQGDLTGVAYATMGETPSVVILKPTVKGRLLIVHVWRLQRIFRRKRFERRALSVMMAAHPRLGKESLLAGLPTDLLGSLVCKFL